MLMDVGPDIIDRATGRICCPNYDTGQIPMMLKEPTDARLPPHMILPESNKMIQARASSNVKGVHAAINIIMSRHVQSVLNIRVNSVTNPGYDGFNSTTPSLILW